MKITTVGQLKSAILAINPTLKYSYGYVTFLEEYTKKTFKNGFTWRDLFAVPDHISLLEEKQHENGKHGTLILCEIGRGYLAQATGITTQVSSKTKKKVIVKCKITDSELLDAQIAGIINNP